MALKNQSGRAKTPQDARGRVRIRDYLMGTSYLPPEGDKPGRVRFTLRLEDLKSHHLKLMALAWNGFDAAIGRKRRHKWKPTSILEHFATVTLEEFHSQVGGPQREDESDAEFVRRAVAELRKAAKK